ncbi:MAG: hypothetical protein ACR2RB_14415 [Gammaproteobacteria bacterium]
MNLPRAAALAAVLMTLAGCDPVTVGEAPRTGQTQCLADYRTCVDPIFHSVLLGATGQVTCSAGGCHDNSSGSGGAFKIIPNPGTDADLAANFNTARAFSNLGRPADSKLLLEPLAGTSDISGTHTGGDIFPGTGDVCYQAIIDWISLRVDDQNSAGCGACSVPNLSQCGF